MSTGRVSGRIPASRNRETIQLGVGAVGSMPLTRRATNRVAPAWLCIGASSLIRTGQPVVFAVGGVMAAAGSVKSVPVAWRSEEHTSELQSRGHLVCRLLLE